MTTRLTAGDQAPDFSLTDDSGETVTLSDLRGRKAIVYVYPAALTPGCTTQACDFSDNLESLTGQGYAVVGVSPDAPEKLARFREKEGLSITLLSDPGKEMLREWGAFGEKKLYGKVVEGVIRSTFVLDEEGVLTHAWYNVRASGHVAKIMRDLGLDSA